MSGRDVPSELLRHYSPYAKHVWKNAFKAISDERLGKEPWEA